MDLLPFFLEDDEDLLLCEILNKKKFYQLERKSGPFSLDNFTDEFCWIHFRFWKKDLKTLKHTLAIPDILKCNNFFTVGGMEALCILLKRLAYPNRYADLMGLFPRKRCELSRVFNQMVELILAKHKHLLSNLDRLSINDMELFSEALREKGSTYANCVGFVDGTVRPICRPGVDQKEFYNSHKRVHALKYQSFNLPNGIIAHLHGPVPGRRHDAFVLNSSNLNNLFEQLIRGQPVKYHMYADLGYPLLPTLMTPFRGQNLTRVQKKCNKRMSSIRQSVEWGFGKILQLFAFLDYKKNLKIGMQPVGKYYYVAAILTNCHTCLYNSETSNYFDCQPPMLEDYINS